MEVFIDVFTSATDATPVVSVVLALQGVAMNYRQQDAAWMREAGVVQKLAQFIAQRTCILRAIARTGGGGNGVGVVPPLTYA